MSPQQAFTFTISQAVTQDELKDVARLFTAYAESLGIDLSFQGFAAELSALPGKYAQPGGTLLLARDSAGQAFGCVGLRPLQHGTCEMKRLYVTADGRGTGAGRSLAQNVINHAREAEYSAIRLDTLSSMTSATALYKRFGFREISAYYDTPLLDTIFLELKL